MVDVEIGRRRRKVAQTWNELTGPQLLQVCQVYGLAFDTPGPRYKALLRILFAVPNRVMNRINVVQFVDLKPLATFLLDPTKGRPLTDQLLPRLPTCSWAQLWAGVRSRTPHLYGPRDSFRNLTFAEFIFADTFFLRYLQTNEEAWLNKLVAVLYRPQREDYRPHAASYGGDRREDFNEHLLDARAGYMARVPHYVKLAVLLYYQGCRRELERRYQRVFEGDTNQKAALSGWEAVLHNLADGVHRVEATAGQSLHNVMREMQRVLENYDRAKAAHQAS
ncbi:hypothetical protein [Hymenobacter sp. BT491]|uniref:hypothetical protein n=1 Tax=Hymenobacter sp. BT491 TaxID=2766779 RepID=UPI001653EBB2|nr:hypothetical protein [Hymenobacter sp. BT491]MBC6988573.1 hypothetical protein [Hymenobacter sp. BT491]